MKTELEKIDRLFHAHNCEREGFDTRTPEEWLQVVDEAFGAFQKIKQKLANKETPEGESDMSDNDTVQWSKALSDLCHKNKVKRETLTANKETPESEGPEVWFDDLKGLVYGDAWAIATVLQTEFTRLQQEVVQLRGYLRECAGDLLDWGQYASDYFQKKHDLQENYDKYMKLAEETKP